MRPDKDGQLLQPRDLLAFVVPSNLRQAIKSTGDWYVENYNTARK